MYPGVFFWWNPVIHFPLSGAVTQDFEQTINSLRHRVNRLSGTVFELAAHQTALGQKPSSALTEHLFALATYPDLPKGEAIDQRAAQIGTLLKMLRNLDPDEFECIVRSVSEERRD